LVDAGVTTSINAISAKGSIDNYLQLNIQNTSATSGASSDLVATSNNGDESNGFVDLGINSSAYNAAAYNIGGFNDAYLYSVATAAAVGGNLSIGTGSSGKVIKFHTGGTTSANERMRIDGNGNVGIGTTAPATALHVFGLNPLTLTGVQLGTTTTADSFLTINSGTVQKLPVSTFATTSNSWSTTGNAGTTSTTNFIGTTDNKSFKIKTNGAQGFLLDSLGSVAIGTAPTFATAREKFLVDAGVTTSINAISAKGSIDNYLQLNIQNTSATTGASSDLVATSNNGDESNGFVDLGINSSAYNAAAYNIGGFNDAYLYSMATAATVGGNLSIGTGSSGKVIKFHTGGTTSANERMRIDGNGNVGIGTTSPATALHVFGLNPLTLTGVQLGTTTTTDSLLTINSGTVQKLPVSTFATPTNSWSTIGNTGTTSTTNFIGTTDNKSLKIKTNNTQGFILDSLGSVGIGASPTFTSGTYREKFLVDAGTTTSYNPMVVQGSIDSFFQFNIQNLSAGTHASSDVVATSNNGSQTSYYVDMGINGSNNASNIFGNKNDAYLYNSGENFFIANSTPAKSLIFMTGGTDSATNERMRINGSGNVGIGIAAPTAVLQLGAGTSSASTSPLKFTAGTSLAATEAGAVEYDGVNTYITNETASGRGAIPVEQHFLLSSAGSTISTIANYFGTTSNIPLVSGGYYEIGIECYFLKTGVGTVTWTFTNSAAPTSMDLHYDFSAATGISTAPVASYLSGDQHNITTTAPTVLTASLTTTVNHYAHFKIILLNSTGTSLKIQATSSAGTITPGIGSRWYCKRISTSNVGTFAN